MRGFAPASVFFGGDAEITPVRRQGHIAFLLPSRAGLHFCGGLLFGCVERMVSLAFTLSLRVAIIFHDNTLAGFYSILIRKRKETAGK
ncbi:MAG: hypothetical protein CMK09_06190 [Ponticaulis sp.]|nr:hypothetical protein [Ponticaulis sp.]